MSSSKVFLRNRRSLIIVLVLMGFTSVFFYLTDPVLAGIPLIIFGMLVLVMIISEDAARHAHPIIMAEFAENHRDIILENVGTTAAEKIQVTGAGIQESWSIETLEPDTKTKIVLPAMIALLTVEVTYQVQGGVRKSKVFTLGTPGDGQDPFKPVFPLFGWQGKEK
jgi:hypothetical protein